MTIERVRFVFGVDVAPVDVDDDDELIRWAEGYVRRANGQSHGDELFDADLFDADDDPFDDVVADDLPASAFVAPIRQLLADDPPEAWEAVQRMLAAGFDRDRALRQVVTAFIIHVQHLLDRDGPAEVQVGGSFTLAERYEALPFPTADDIERALTTLLDADPGLDWRSAVALASEDLGSDPFGSLVESVMNFTIEELIELDVIGIYGGDQLVHLPTISAGSVLTHRLTDTEIELGTLNCLGGNLALFAHHEQPVLADGSPIEVFSLDDDHLGWGRRDRAWLAMFAPGDLVAVRVDRSGLVSIERIDDPDTLEGPAADDLVRTIADVIASESDDIDVPLRALDVLVAVVGDEPEMFRHPLPPVTELAIRAGLEVRFGRIGRDDESWDRLDTLRRHRRLADDAPSDEIAEAAASALDLVASSELDGDDTRTLFALLADPEVAQLVADELIRGGVVDSTGADAALDATGRLVAVARRGTQQATALLVAGLVAEGLGRVEDADAHFKAGLAADASAVLLVDRVAWYASDRGDAATAARLWARLDGEPGELAVVEQHARRRDAGPRVGRNDPCWCGSGRKFKSCHLGVASMAPLPDRVDWICRKQTSWLTRQRGETRGILIDLARARAADGDDPASVVRAFDDPLVFDVAFHELGMEQVFLAERGPLLPDDERLLVGAWILGERSVHEVLEVRRDEGLTVRDLRTGDHIVVRERSLTNHVGVGDLFCARIVPDGVDHGIIGGVFPVSPGTETSVLTLCDERDASGLCEWARRIEQPPTLSTREGEPMLEVIIEARVADPDAAAAALDACYEADDTAPTGAQVWREMHPIAHDESIVRATLRLEGDHLVVVTNSDVRADRVISRLRAEVPDLVITVDDRGPIDLGDLRRRADTAAALAASASSIELDADEREELLAMLEDRWMSEPVPALGGVTPIEAAADPTRRDSLVRLLRSFPEPDEGDLGLRPSRIAAALGLDR